MISAYQPWTPTYLDVEHRRQDGDPQYQNVGFTALVFPAGASHLTSHRTTLEERFFERYAMRRLNEETLERWQVRLQNRLDEIADRYDRAYGIYTTYASQMDNDILEGWKDTASGSDTKNYNGSEALEMSGTEKVSDTGSTVDTPDAAINSSDNYADAVRKNDSERSFTNRKDTRSFTGRNDKTDYGKVITRVLTGNSILDNVNYSIEHWMDIDTLFVKEFENLFLNVFDY